MKKILLVALIGVTAFSAYAQDSRAERAQEMKDKLTERFNAADADHDGRLTKLEAEGKMPRVAKNFDAIDVQKRGYVTIEQIEKFTVQQLRKRKGKKSSADDE